MEKRSYKKFNAVYDELLGFCRNRSGAGCFLLPPERELAELLGSSRMTLRKAMEQAELTGVIRRENKRSIILPEHLPLNRCGKILFVTAGNGSGFNSNAMERLWFKVRSEITMRGGKVELYQQSGSPSIRNMMLQVAQADVILLTIFYPGSDSMSELLDYLRQVARRKPVISLIDHHSECFDHYACMDNYAAGAIAAQALLDAGCKRPGIIKRFDAINIFRRRIAGFHDRVRTYGREMMISSISGDDDHFAIIHRNQLLELRERGCDGVFLASDECVGLIGFDLFADGTIPNRLKLITVNGSGDALRHSPRVACVSHATDAVVAAMLRQLESVVLGNFFANSERLYIKPELFRNETL